MKLVTQKVIRHRNVLMITLNVAFKDVRDYMIVSLGMCGTISPVALQLRPPPKVSARAPAHRSYHFRGVKLKSCIKKIHHNLYISKQANVRIKHADTEDASHKKFGTDARVQ